MTEAEMLVEVLRANDRKAMDEYRKMTREIKDIEKKDYKKELIFFNDFFQKNKAFWSKRENVLYVRCKHKYKDALKSGFAICRRCATRKISNMGIQIHCLFTDRTWQARVFRIERGLPPSNPPLYYGKMSHPARDTQRTHASHRSFETHPERASQVARETQTTCASQMGKRIRKGCAIFKCLHCGKLNRVIQTGDPKKDQLLINPILCDNPSCAKPGPFRLEFLEDCLISERDIIAQEVKRGEDLKRLKNIQALTFGKEVGEALDALLRDATSRGEDLIHAVQQDLRFKLANANLRIKNAKLMHRVIPRTASGDFQRFLVSVWIRSFILMKPGKPRWEVGVKVASMTATRYFDEEAPATAFFEHLVKKYNLKEV